MSRGMLFLRAHTSVHPGTGATAGPIDLPIQRERHTGWPMIQGSSIKGVLRDRYRHEVVAQGKADSLEKADTKDLTLVAIFGRGVELDTDEGYQAGALAVTDARILAFPARSAKGVFAWVTCPSAISRLLEDLKVTGANKPPEAQGIMLDDEHASVAADSPVRVTVGSEQRLVIEDLSLRIADTASESQRSALAEWIVRQALRDSPDAAKRIVVIADNPFSYLVRHATEVVQRIALQYETKRVKQGALFSQEFLPPETLMYSILLVEEPRGNKCNLDSAGMLDLIKRACNERLLQFGGDETTGKGLCWVFIHTANELNA